MFTLDRLSFRAALYACPTAEALWSALPFQSEVHTWGEEIYFVIPVQVALDETASDNVALGDVGYWPDGSALCIFFGKTPISGEDEIRPAGPVNVFGKILDPVDMLHTVRQGTPVRVQKVE